LSSVCLLFAWVWHGFPNPSTLNLANTPDPSYLGLTIMSGPRALSLDWFFFIIQHWIDCEFCFIICFNLFSIWLWWSHDPSYKLTNQLVLTRVDPICRCLIFFKEKDVVSNLFSQTKFLLIIRVIFELAKSTKSY
jgi:hypothetical protein